MLNPDILQAQKYFKMLDDAKDYTNAETLLGMMDHFLEISGVGRAALNVLDPSGKKTAQEMKIELIAAWQKNRRQNPQLRGLDDTRKKLGYLRGAYSIIAPVTNATLPLFPEIAIQGKTQVPCDVDLDLEFAKPVVSNFLDNQPLRRHARKLVTYQSNDAMPSGSRSPTNWTGVAVAIARPGTKKFAQNAVLRKIASGYGPKRIAVRNLAHVLRVLHSKKAQDPS